MLQPLRHLLPLPVAAALALVIPLPAPAAEIQQLQAEVTGAQVQVSFELADALDEKLQARIDSGLPTGIVYDIELLRDRKHWWDDKVEETTLEVVAMYNAVAHEYLVNFKQDGRLVESRLARSKAELKAAMTHFERVTVFSLEGFEPEERLLVKARADLGSKTWLGFIPVDIQTDWEQSRKFRAP